MFASRRIDRSLATACCRLFAPVLLAAALAACSSSVTRAPETGLQQPQFDDPGEKAGNLTVSLSDQGREEAAENLKFNQHELHDTVKRALELNDLLTPEVDPALPEIEIVVTSVRSRSNFSAVMFGFLAGDDHINGDVIVRAPDDSEKQRFSINASYALGGLAGGSDEVRMDWLYETFAEHVLEELSGKQE